MCVFLSDFNSCRLQRLCFFRSSPSLFNHPWILLKLDLGYVWWCEFLTFFCPPPLLLSYWFEWNGQNGALTEFCVSILGFCLMPVYFRMSRLVLFFFFYLMYPFWGNEIHCSWACDILQELLILNPQCNSKTRYWDWFSIGLLRVCLSASTLECLSSSLSSGLSSGFKDKNKIPKLKRMSTVEKERGLIIFSFKQKSLLGSLIVSLIIDRTV